MSAERGRTADGIEGLYPFLYAETSDVEIVLDEVRLSTLDKAREIGELRRRVAAEMGEQLVACATAVAHRVLAGGRVLAFGNGGSSTDAADIATRLLFPSDGGPTIPALSLTADVATVTALTNDVGFDVVFARQIAALARPHDVAVGISTSGNSPNLIAGLEEAARRGLLTVGLAGYDGGKMAECGVIDHLFVVPSASVHRVQEAQTTIYHALCELTSLALTRAKEDER